MKPEPVEIARRSFLLVSAPADVARTVLASARLQSFDRGATIFLPGERASAIYIVAEGPAKLQRIAPNGAGAPVGVFTRGRSFGEAAFGHDPCPVAAGAVADCSLIRIEVDAVPNLIRKSPGIAVSMLSATDVHPGGPGARIEALKAKTGVQTGAQKVAEFLLKLARARAGPREVVVPDDGVLIEGRPAMKPRSPRPAFSRLRERRVTIRQNRAEIADLERCGRLSGKTPRRPGAAG